MTNVAEIEQGLVRFIEGELLFDKQQTRIATDEPLLQGLLDSLDVLRLVVHIEEQFLIRVEDGELVPNTFGTVARIAQYVQTKQASKG